MECKSNEVLYSDCKSCWKKIGIMLLLIFFFDWNLFSQAYRKGFIQPGPMLLDHWWRITMKMLSRNDHPALRTTTPRWTGGWKTESFAVTPGIISLEDFLPLSSCEKRKSQVKKMFSSQWNLLIDLSLRKRMVKLPKVALISSPCFLHLFFRFSLNFPSKTQTVSITGRWIFARTLKKRPPSKIGMIIIPTDFTSV